MIFEKKVEKSKLIMIKYNKCTAVENCGYIFQYKCKGMYMILFGLYIKKLLYKI